MQPEEIHEELKRAVAATGASLSEVERAIDRLLTPSTPCLDLLETIEEEIEYSDCYAIENMNWWKDLDRVHWALLWEPRDLWLGIYWTWEFAIGIDFLKLYFCLLPTLVLRCEIPFQPEERAAVATTLPKPIALFLSLFCGRVGDGRSTDIKCWNRAAAEHIAWVLAGCGVRSIVMDEEF